MKIAFMIMLILANIIYAQDYAIKPKLESLLQGNFTEAQKDSILALISDSTGVIRAEDFGVSSSNDDNITYLTAAIESLTKGQTLRFNTDTIKIKSGDSISVADNTILDFNGAYLKYDYDAKSPYGLDFRGTLVLTTTLVGTYEIGDRTIHLTSIAGVQKGDLIVFNQNPDDYYGELNKIEVVDDSLTLYYGLVVEYDALSSISIYRPIKNLTIKNLNILSSDTCQVVFRLDYTNNLTLENVTIDGLDSTLHYTVSYGLYLYAPFHLNANNLTLKNCTQLAGETQSRYPLIILRARGGVVSNSRGYNNWHSFEASEGTVDLIFDRCESSTDYYGFRHHSARRLIYKDCITNAGLGIRFTGKDVVVDGGIYRGTYKDQYVALMHSTGTGNNITIKNATLSMDKGGVIRFDQGMGADITIDNCTFELTDGNWQYFANPGFTTETFAPIYINGGANINFTNNTVKVEAGATLNQGYLAVISADSGLTTNINFSNNHIINSPKYTAYFYSRDSSTTNLIIKENLIEDTYSYAPYRCFNINDVGDPTKFDVDISDNIIKSEFSNAVIYDIVPNVLTVQDNIDYASELFISNVSALTRMSTGGNILKNLNTDFASGSFLTADYGLDYYKEKWAFRTNNDTLSYELSVNKRFDYDITGWLANNITLSHYTSDDDVIGGTKVLKGVATNTSSVFGYFDVNLDSGYTYQFSYDYYIPSTNTSANRTALLVYDGSTNELIGYGTTTDAWTTYTASFTMTTDKTRVLVYQYVNTGGTGITVGDKIYLDNFSVKKEENPFPTGVKISSDSTGLSTGTIYFDATGNLKRKY